MKQRLLKGWSIRRAIYLIMGLAIAFQAAAGGAWPGVLAGGYFTAMGLLGFGCAGGNCCAPSVRKQSENDTEVSYEEVA
ncbi:hypothetical protein [Rurimicrobium arvi]|uniref:DUF2892 domain-containing protein n=1 Tax=Rurimicrobium arvi TaxID=2049916 RepID=A0ABP8N330_9BACT